MKTSIGDEDDFCQVDCYLAQLQLDINIATDIYARNCCTCDILNTNFGSQKYIPVNKLAAITNKTNYTTIQVS